MSGRRNARKHLLTTNFEVPFLLKTDASVQGLGAVLAQRQADDTVRPSLMRAGVYSHTRRATESQSWKDWGTQALPSLSVWAPL